MQQIGSELYFFLILHQTATEHNRHHGAFLLYFFLILHQTATRSRVRISVLVLYFFLILHQTATPVGFLSAPKRCISSLSYIKPQLHERRLHHSDGCISSLSYIKPQLFASLIPLAVCCISSLSYIKPQLRVCVHVTCNVVFLPYPTSNRNKVSIVGSPLQLYFFLILHQTATHSMKIWVQI